MEECRIEKDYVCKAQTLILGLGGWENGDKELPLAVHSAGH